MTKTNANDSGKEAGPAAAPVRRLRRWIVAVVWSLLLAAVVVGLLEGGLRIAGYGHETGFLIRAGEFYQSNPAFARRFFPGDVGRPPLPIHVAAEKPSDSVRILVLGGSAAQGYPDPGFSFDRYLEVILREKLPGVRFEVISAAMTAANSHMMVQVARDCAVLRPDILIVYMGNNEVVGPFGAGGVFGSSSNSRWAIRTSLWLRQFRVGQWLASLGRSRGAPDDWSGMRMFLDHQVPAGDERLTATYEHFRRNLAEICQTGRDIGADVIVCTVPVNLRHCAPFASDTDLCGLDEEEANAWEDLYQRGVQEQADGDLVKAVESFESALAIHERRADHHFRLGQCYLVRGEPARATAHFRKARELDTLRFRADATINETIRRVVREAGASVELVDAEQAFARADGVPAECPGEELFFDHVHPNYRGNYLLARNVYVAINDRKADTGDPPTSEQCDRLLGLTHEVRVRNAKRLWDLMADAPFTNQLNYRKVRRRMLARREGLWAKRVLPSEAIAIYTEALAAAPADARLRVGAADAWGRAAVTAGDRRLFAEAAEHLARAKELLPNDPEPWLIETKMHLSRGDTPTAREALNSYLELKGHSLSAYRDAVGVLETYRAVREAERFAHEAVERMPEDMGAATLLARTVKDGRAGRQAMQSLAEALERQPDYAEGWCVLGLCQLSRSAGFTGDSGSREATKSFERAIELDPRVVPAYEGLAGIYFRHGRLDKAKAYLAKAVDLAPDNLAATVKYAELLCMEGNVRSAVALLRRGLRISPGTPPVAGKLAWILATTADAELRDGPAAVELATQAVAGSNGRPQAMGSLAAAYAADGQFNQAIAVAKEALTRSRQMGNAQLAQRLAKHLAAYQRARPLVIESYDRLEGW